jgi:hypothetical protein
MREYVGRFFSSSLLEARPFVFSRQVDNFGHSAIRDACVVVMITIRTLASSPLLTSHSQETACRQPDGAKEQQSKRSLVVGIQINHDGVAWRGLHPLLYEAPPPIARRAARILIREFRGAIRQRIRPLDIDDAAVLHVRTIPSKKKRTLHILLLPLQSTSLQYTFVGILIRYEHIWLSMCTLSAWIATLGGGYFLCRHLSTAVFLAKQQRAVALWMGDFETADQCTLNEAFNYIHSGHFVRAKKMIIAVHKTATRRQDKLTLRMVTAASLFLQRVKRASKFVERAAKDDTVDDYQRIRLFDDRSQAKKALRESSETS